MPPADIDDLLAAASPEIRAEAEKFRDALAYVPMGTIFKNEATAPEKAMPTDKRVGFALKSSGIHVDNPALAAALAAGYDAANKGSNASGHYRGADPNHPNPITLATIYKLADENHWPGLTSPTSPTPPKSEIAPPSESELTITEEEMLNAQAHPPCIVERYLYCNLAMLAAPGGVGKTTLVLYEAIRIALGEPVWGLPVRRKGWTLIVTAEDSREELVARIKEILNTMNLPTFLRDAARESVKPWDVTGQTLRLAELNASGNIELTALADAIVGTYRNNPPVMVVFDPAVSFGPGERIVNDGEQAIVTACRRIIRGLGCCVRIIHHTGKTNARAGATDQYASRGGTALPDGSRMVAVLASHKEAQGTPPEGFEVGPNDSGFMLARAKLSYCPPQPNIWIRRRGFTYEYFVETPKQKGRDYEKDIQAVFDFLKRELEEGRQHTSSTLDALGPRKLDIPRVEIRAALAELTLRGCVHDEPLPQEGRKGGRKTYLKPVRNPAEDFGGVDLE